MLFKIESKPNAISSLLPQEIPLPQFPLFGKFEIDGTTCTITGLEYCRQEVAHDRDVQPGWVYQLDDGSSLTTMIAEQELLDCLPINQVEVIAIAA